MTGSIYFFCYPMGPPEKAGYQHQIINLAEGLRILNVPFFSNVNYWKINCASEEYLLSYNNSVDYRKCTAVVFSSWLIIYNRLDLLPKDLFDSKRNYKIIFIDDADGLITPGFDLSQKVDIVLKSHYNRKYAYPVNFIPWQFGLSNRIIQSVSPLPYSERHKTILFNFRISHPVRTLAREKVLPYFYPYLSPDFGTDPIDVNHRSEDRLFWHQSGRRHNSSFYKRLSQSTACACFGGELQNSFSNVKTKLGYFLQKLDHHFHFLNPDRVFQFDSWRFWESLASGTCTIHLDLEKYGVCLPVMPENGKHYIGVDIDNLPKLRQILHDESVFEDIGNNGREWVLQHYSPKQIALRFLNLLHSFV